MTTRRKTPVLFVATLGQTDLQLVVEVADRDGSVFLASAPVRKPSTRVVHDSLLREFADIGLATAGGPLAEATGCEVAVVEGKIDVVATSGSRDPLPTLQRTVGGQLSVFPRLLADAAARWPTDDANSSEELVGVLLCQTARTPTKTEDPGWTRMVAGEPHAAGEILAMWFESQCGLRAADGPIRTATDVKAGHCMWLNLLQGFEYAELRYSDDRQVTLARPAMLMRMDAAIKAVANWAQPPERVYFHHDGGMPTMFEAVADALAFRLPDADLLVQRRDRGGIDTATRPYPGLRPGESLRQRAAARELVDSGRFADAALLARAMQSRVAKRERWVYQLRRVSDWLRGIATADPARGSIAGTGHSDIVDAVMDGWHIMDALKGSAGEAVHSWLTTALSAEAAAQAGDAAELTQLLCTMADAVHERILVPVAPTRAEVRDMPAREARLQDLKRWSKPKWWGARLAAMACAYANAVDQRTRTGRQDSLRDLRNQLLHEGRAQRTMDDLRPALRRAGVHIDAAGLRVLKPGSPVHNVGLALGVDLAASYTVLLHATRSEVEHIEYSWWGEP